jgi:ATP-dependent Clp protease ATP-binding subunit ClpA
MFERFAASARIAVEDAKYEAARRGDRRVGTEHLLLALLRNDDIAQLIGVDGETAHVAAEELDRSALAAIGMELDTYQPAGRAALGRMVPLTAGAKAVIQQSLATAATEKARTITTRHIMLALLDRPQPDPTASLFAALSVDRREVRDRLATAA